MKDPQKWEMGKGVTVVTGVGPVTPHLSTYQLKPLIYTYTKYVCNLAARSHHLTRESLELFVVLLSFHHSESFSTTFPSNVFDCSSWPSMGYPQPQAELQGGVAAP